MPPRPDTTAGNIVVLEHVNLRQSDQQLATLFYVVGLRLTRDPYLMVGLDNMWINIGKSQLHLPTCLPPSQRLRGVIGLVVPDLDVLERSLRGIRTPLAQTQFAFAVHADHIDVVCPWGNRFTCHAPDLQHWGTMQLGMPYVAFDVPPGTATAISNFYVAMLGATTSLHSHEAELQTVVVRAGEHQQLRFVETRKEIAPYDGHHIQIYLDDFDGPHERLKERGLISRETNEHEWRFFDIIDLDTGRVVHQLEHEVRSLRNPLYGRALVNRNASQSNVHYVPGADNFPGAQM